MLLNAGFSDVQSLDGGINAWKGLVAEGVPDGGMAYFDTTEKAEELIALAWIMEDGSRRFYEEVSSNITDDEGKNLFKQLVTAEEHHKSSLLDVYKEITGKEDASHFTSLYGEDESYKDIMEGGMKVTEALEWIQNKNVSEILELSMSLETNAYDLYILMQRKMEGEKSKKVFRTLAEEEKLHLDRMSALLEKRLDKAIQR